MGSCEIECCVELPHHSLVSSVFRFEGTNNLFCLLLYNSEFLINKRGFGFIDMHQDAEGNEHQFCVTGSTEVTGLSNITKYISIIKHISIKSVVINPQTGVAYHEQVFFGNQWRCLAIWNRLPTFPKMISFSGIYTKIKTAIGHDTKGVGQPIYKHHSTVLIKRRSGCCPRHKNSYLGLQSQRTLSRVVVTKIILSWIVVTTRMQHRRKVSFDLVPNVCVLHCTADFGTVLRKFTFRDLVIVALKG